jgi:hypothetical protein
MKRYIDPIQYAREAIQVERKQYEIRNARRGTHWSAADIETVRNEYREYRASGKLDELATKLSRTRQGVKKMAQKLGLCERQPTESPAKCCKLMNKLDALPPTDLVKVLTRAVELISQESQRPVDSTVPPQ